MHNCNTFPGITAASLALETTPEDDRRRAGRKRTRQDTLKEDMEMMGVDLE